MTPQPITRRAVLGGLALGATAPVWLRFAEPALAATATGTTRGANASRHVLVVFLRGGNDPLRTISPIGDARLLKMRPNVGLKADEMLPLGNGLGLNKLLPSLFGFWKANQLAVVQQVGTTAEDDFSHSGAIRRWESGSPDGRFPSGWLGRYLDATSGVGSVRAAAFGSSMPLSLVGAKGDALTMTTLSDFAFADAKRGDAAARRAALTQLANSAAPAGSMAATLLSGQRELLGAVEPVAQIAAATKGHELTAGESIAQLFAAGLGTEIGFLSLDGFDLHTREAALSEDVLTSLDNVVKTFFSTATSLGVANSSMVMVVSEFGRRVYENGSGGTDHGISGNVLALGPGVKGGMYGPTLDLGQLVDGNVPTRVDLRSVYATVLSSWLQTDPAPILGGTFPLVPFVR